VADGASGAVDEGIDARYERAELWPVGLTFIESGGLTLWGSGGAPDGRDRLLVDAGRLVLLPSPARLGEYVSRDTSSALASLPGYPVLREHVAMPHPLAPVVEHDYRAVAAVLQGSADAWTREDCSDLLDALNMLSDIALALEDDDLARAFDDEPFVVFQERVTFLEEEDLPAARRDFDTGGLFRLLGQALARIQRRILVPS
jgi:hypothetical protein